MVFTTDEKKAERFGLGVRAGTVWVNCFLVRDLTAPFGGIGISGIGREGGDYALDFYSDLKTLSGKGGDHPWVRSSARVSSRTCPPSCCPTTERRALNNGNESTLYTGLHNAYRGLRRAQARPRHRLRQPLVHDGGVRHHLGARRLGFFTSEELPRGMSSVPYDAKGDPEFAAPRGRHRRRDPRLLDHADRQRAPTRSSTPRRTSSRSCRATKRGSRSAPARPPSPKTSPRSGESIAARPSSSSRPAGHPHRLGGAQPHVPHPAHAAQHEAAGEEHIFSNDARRADHGVIDALVPGRPRQRDRRAIPSS